MRATPATQIWAGRCRGVAQLIRAGGVRVAAVDSNGYNYRGWDMHVGLGGNTDQNSWMWGNLQSTAQTLAAFVQDLGPTLMSKVTLVTLSEFGRRAYENDSGGLDHGHGHLMMVVGGGINGGGQVLGKWEGLSPTQLDSNGNLRGTNDYRAVIAEIPVQAAELQHRGHQGRVPEDRDDRRLELRQLGRRRLTKLRRTSTRTKQCSIAWLFLGAMEHCPRLFAMQWNIAWYEGWARGGVGGGRSRWFVSCSRA